MVFPFVSGLLLVFVGVLIGYFLSSRENNDHENNRLGLAKENSELRESIQRGRESLAEIEAKYSRQNGQLNVLQQLCDDWSASREESERERSKLEVLVNELQNRTDELTGELAEQSQRRIDLEDRLHQTQHEHVERLGTVETNWIKKHSETESVLAQRESDIQHLNEERDRLTKQLHASEARIAELNSELDSQRTLYETASNNASGLKQEYTSLETSLKHSSMRLKDAEAKCAKATSAKNLAEESLQALREQLDQQREQNVDLKGQLASLQALKQQFGAVQESLSNSDNRLQVVLSERDRAIGAEKAAYEHMSGLHKRLENQESTIKALRNNHDQALENLRSEVENRTATEKRFEQQILGIRSELQARSQELESAQCERDEVIASLTDQRDEFAQRLEQESAKISNLIESGESTASQLAAIQSRNDELEVQLARESEQRELHESNWKQSSAELLELKAESERLHNSLSGESRERNDLLEHCDALQTQLESQCAISEQLESQNQNLERSFQTLKARSDAMMNELGELQSIRDQHSNANDKWKEYRIRLEQTIGQRDHSMSLLSAKQAEIQSMELQLGSANETVRQLRDRIAELTSGNTRDHVILSLSQARTTVDHEYGGTTRVDETRGVVFTERPKIVDDLKMISGVAEVLEGKLNDYGVYTFRQVMEWNETNIDEFKQLLPSFKDRIVREDWIGQAAHLYQHFHGDSSETKAA